MQKNFTYKPIIAKVFILALGSFFIFSCNNNAKKNQDDRKYVIPDSLMKKLSVDTAKKCQLVNSITLTGQVDFNQDHVIKLYSPVSGNISNINVVLGDYVKQGQVLGVIKSPEMAGYSNNLIVAETNLSATKKQLEATKDLFKSGLASQLDLNTAQVNYDQAVAQLEMVNRVLKINGGGTKGDYEVKAPISGFLVEKLVNNNTSIRTDNGTNLFTISDLKNVWVWANVYESNIPAVRMGENVNVTTLSYPNRIFRGKIDKVMNVLDPTNKVMKVRVSLSNDDYALKPQMFASVTVNNPENKEAICVSSSALIFDHSQYYVLAYHSRNDVRITPVQVISSNEGRTYISGGVQEGDQVIASDAVLIYDALNN